MTIMHQIPEALGPSEHRHEIELSVGTKEGHVCIDFGTSVSWIALPPEVADDLAMAILRRTDQLKT